MKKDEEEEDNTVVMLIGLVIFIVVIYSFFNYKPKTERYQEVLKELKAQEKNK